MIDQGIVEKFAALEEIDEVAIPTASLAVLWYLNEAGEPAFAWKFDGDIPRSSSIGDLTRITHWLMHDEDPS